LVYGNLEVACRLHGQHKIVVGDEYHNRELFIGILGLNEGRIEVDFLYRGDADPVCISRAHCEAAYLRLLTPCVFKFELDFIFGNKVEVYTGLFERRRLV